MLGTKLRPAVLVKQPPARYGPALTELEVLEHARTPIGTIYLGRRPAISGPGWIHEIRIDGALLMSNINPVSERQLTSSALELHSEARDLSVMVGGLGLGHTTEIALQSPRVASVRVVEKMDFVIDWMNRGLLPLSESFAADERLTIERGDVYEELLAPPSRQYDLILVDVDHSPHHPLSEASLPFYTEAGQRQVAAHLRPGGYLAVWSVDDSENFMQVLESVYPRTKREQVEWVNEDKPTLNHNVLFFAGVD